MIRTRISHARLHLLTLYSRLLAAMHSSLGHYGIAGKILELLPQGNLDEQTDHPSDRSDAIVTQSDELQKQDALNDLPARQTSRLKVGSQVALAILLIISIWWVLPREVEPRPVRSEALPTSATSAIERTNSLAIVNPVNLSAAPTVAVQPPAIVVAAADQTGRTRPSVAFLPTVTPAGIGITETTDSPETVVEIAIPTAAAQASEGGQGAGQAETELAVDQAAEESVVLRAERDRRTDIALAAGRSPEKPTPRVPQVRILPALGLKLSPTPAPPTATPPATPTATATPLRLSAGRLWSNFVPKGPELDHFWIERAFPSGAQNQVASPNYQFGSTAGNRYRPHHGVDISSPQGSPVRAATDGEVIHAGWDDPALLGPYNSFYGNTVVIRLDRRLPVAGGELDVFLLYGHLSETSVEVGQRVQPDDIVGRVGMTGIAIGPHLHVEARLGANTYQHSVNPYLWITPVDNTGAVAVRLLTADGRTWAGARLTLARYENGKAIWVRPIETYLDVENIGPDPVWGENGAMGSVPAGYYVIAGNVNGERVRAELAVTAGQTTFIELRTQQ